MTFLIFYNLPAPHVGHLYTMVMADVLKRWQMLLGKNDAQLLTGTDEHGLKVAYDRQHFSLHFSFSFLFVLTRFPGPAGRSRSTYGHSGALRPELQDFPGQSWGIFPFFSAA